MEKSNSGMDEEQYREKGRVMTLNYLEENELYIRIHGTFNASSISINEYHDPSEVDADTFYFEARHNFQFDFVDRAEAAATEL